MTRRLYGPFNRVEGDLEVSVEIERGAVRSARVIAPMYRGFETILSDREPEDALVFAPRICGICSVSQSIAAARALADEQAWSVPPNGRLALNLIHATENVADHLTHFYLFFMPDLADAGYAGLRAHDDLVERFRPVKGTASEAFLPARAGFMHLLGVLAGKWPHTLSIRPNGSSRAVTREEIGRMRAILHGMRRFLERTLFADTLERICALGSVDALQAWSHAARPAQGDLRRFMHAASECGFASLGRVRARFMSYGAYPDEAGHLFARGVLGAGGVSALNTRSITEDVSHAWYADTGAPQPPWQGSTRPDAHRVDGYTWCKAPRLSGDPMEVGALARQVIDGHPLAVDLITDGHSNVLGRIVARLLEVARVVSAMQVWLDQLEPGEPFLGDPVDSRAAGERFGLTEAARGSLGHWCRVEGGRLINYQIISPTTWNFSPRDENGVPGPLEQALAGTTVEGGDGASMRVQHIVRSFDPCMVCTVH